MFNLIKNIYKSPDLHGDFLTQPLKCYQATAFVEKIAASSGLAQAAWKTARVVSGLFAYPVLGLIATIGLLVKLTGIPGVCRHNRDEKAPLGLLYTGIKYAATYFTSFAHENVQEGFALKTVKEFRVTKQNVEEMNGAMLRAMNEMSWQFRKVYLCASGRVDREGGEITVQFNVKERAQTQVSS